MPVAGSLTVVLHKVIPEWYPEFQKRMLMLHYLQ